LGVDTIVATVPATGASTSFTLTVFRPGYWLAGADGNVFPLGSAPTLGSLVSQDVRPAQPIVGIAATLDAGGYWLVASEGGIFSFGDANFYGSMGGRQLNAPVVGMAVAENGQRYYEVASDGGVFSFGPGAPFLGSMGSQHLNAPVVAMAVMPSRQSERPDSQTLGGDWLVGADGGAFAFDNTPGLSLYAGSTGCFHLAQPIVDLVARRTSIAR
jgi:hypothetical protein